MLPHPGAIKHTKNAPRAQDSKGNAWLGLPHVLHILWPVHTFGVIFFPIFTEYIDIFSVDTHGLTPVALVKEVCIYLEGCMPSNSL